MTSTFLFQSVGGILGNSVSSIATYLYYGIFIIPAVIILFFIWWWRQRGKVAAQGMNRAMIYSLDHGFTSGMKPFTVERYYDKERNVEETRARFAPTAKSQSTGIRGFINTLLNRAPPPGTEDDKGPIFSESLASYDRESKGWFAIYSLETNLQLPIVTDDKNVKVIIQELERNTEKRVSRLKSAQLAISNYVANSTPAQQLSQTVLVSFVLLFVGILVVAYTLSQISTVIANLTPVLQHIAQIVNATSGNGGIVTGK